MKDHQVVVHWATDNSYILADSLSALLAQAQLTQSRVAPGLSDILAHALTQISPPVQQSIRMEWGERLRRALTTGSSDSMLSKHLLGQDLNDMNLEGMARESFLTGALYKKRDEELMTVSRYWVTNASKIIHARFADTQHAGRLAPLALNKLSSLAKLVCKQMRWTPESSAIHRAMDILMTADRPCEKSQNIVVSPDIYSKTPCFKFVKGPSTNFEIVPKDGQTGAHASVPNASTTRKQNTPVPEALVPDTLTPAIALTAAVLAINSGLQISSQDCAYDSSPSFSDSTSFEAGQSF